jgi:4-diphosphocytidyl-2-C-methyl-D-erythritol kinase
MSRLTVPAYAKINLCLEVLGKRPDGFHEVATVMQTVSLADQLEFECAEADGDVTLVCEGMAVEPSNLILRAAHLLRELTGVRRACAIRCQKRIPIAAGLGGGSADAAATLRALNELWDLGLREDRLAEVGSTLGADVPYCVQGGTALATGIGTEIRWLPPAPRHWVVLVPGSADSDRKTAEMYSALGPRQFSDGSATMRMAEAIARGSIPYEAVRSAFDQVAADRWPPVMQALSVLKAGAAMGVAVSGAGPSVFGLFADEAVARAEAGRLAELNPETGVYAFRPSAQ